MDYLQYYIFKDYEVEDMSFKPYYKWITFNTSSCTQNCWIRRLGLKPYYKWITFNTKSVRSKAKLRKIGF